MSVHKCIFIKQQIYSTKWYNDNTSNGNHFVGIVNHIRSDLIKLNGKIDS